MCDQGNGDTSDPAEDLYFERIVADTMKGKYGSCVMSSPCDTFCDTGGALLRGTGTQDIFCKPKSRKKSSPDPDGRPCVHCESRKWLEFVLK